MTNNDILRSFRYALDLKDATLIACFALAGVTITPAQLSCLLKREQDQGYEPLSDERLGRFLDGFVTSRRGAREPQPGALPEPQQPPPLNNNRILRALRIALALKDTDILEIMSAAGTEISKTELSALFRREDHRNYQPCGNQFLRTFLRGLSLWHRARAPG